MSKFSVIAVAIISAVGGGMLGAYIVSSNHSEPEATTTSVTVQPSSLPPSSDQPSQANGYNTAHLLSESELRSLERQGLSDPAVDLWSDLAAQPELIPDSGVLGGTMRWLFADFQLLSERWAYAAYEDGHVWGECLLEYQIGANKQVRWTVLKSRLWSG